MEPRSTVGKGGVTGAATGFCAAGLALRRVVAAPSEALFTDAGVGHYLASLSLRMLSLE